MDESNEKELRTGMSLPAFRIWLCGTFRVERRVGTIYEAVRTAEWGGSSYPRLLLKALLCRPGRQARREALMELLWPECEPEQAVQNLNTATSKLRNVLRLTKEQESLLLTTNDATMYRLPGQEQLWVDTDAALGLLRQAERLERTSAKALALLEEADHYFSQGSFQQDEEGQWVAGRRATVEQARYRCRIWLSEAYEHQNMPGQATTTLSLMLEEEPLDEDVLCRLMKLLYRQGMTHQAMRLYEQTCQVFAREKLELTETTKKLAKRLEKDRQYFSQEKADLVSERPDFLSLQSRALPLSSTDIGSFPYATIVVPPVIPSSFPDGTLPLDCASGIGIHLAQIMTLIRQWYGMAMFCGELQEQLDREIKQLDWMKTRFPLEECMLSRRTLLMTLAMLPTSLTASSQQRYRMILALEEFLPTCTASITACWHLSGGSRDALDIISPVLDSYLPTLMSICKYTPAYREVAADLAAQAYFLKAILSWHREGLKPAEAYCVEALKYSNLTKNVNLRLTALNQHALIAYYNQDFQKALIKSEEAAATLCQASHEPVFPIIAGRVYMYLAAIQAQHRLAGAEATLEQARVAFAAQTTRFESVPVYADCGDASLLLWDGLTYYYLGRHSLEHTNHAFISLSKFGQLAPSTATPERFRLECLNNRTLVAIQRGELEEAIACLEAGRHGAKTLESKQRKREVTHAYHLMCKRWPKEERVKKLRDQQNVES